VILFFVSLNFVPFLLPFLNLLPLAQPHNHQTHLQQQSTNPRHKTQYQTMFFVPTQNVPAETEPSQETQKCQRDKPKAECKHKPVVVTLFYFVLLTLVAETFDVFG
jgi:hypothetical protein